MVEQGICGQIAVTVEAFASKIVYFHNIVGYCWDFLSFVFFFEVHTIDIFRKELITDCTYFPLLSCGSITWRRAGGSCGRFGTGLT